MTVNDDVRDRIVSSVFSKIDESYVSHLKVWEDSGADSEGLKPRYIILSRMCLMLVREPVEAPVDN